MWNFVQNLFRGKRELAPKQEPKDWDWDSEGDEPHRKVCEDGSVITFGISGEDGVLRRAKPEDYPPGCWPPMRVGTVTLPTGKGAEEASDGKNADV